MKIIAFQDMTDTLTIKADVIIIGAGPAGLAVARELAGTGLKILVLESGVKKWTQPMLH